MFDRKILLFCLILVSVAVDKTLSTDNIQDYGAVVKEPVKCPGRYCGRRTLETGNYSSCGACQRGFRADSHSICQPCTSRPTFYDWLYLGFMAMLSLVLHLFFIDFTNKRKNQGLLVLVTSAFVESTLAALSTLLIVEPRGTFQITSCSVKQLSDWYTLLYNPTPGYTSTLHCTQEAVYPLYTMVMIYYAFSLLLMMMFRPLLSSKCVYYRGTRSIYAALYFFPILVLGQAVLGGLLYYSFPYIILAGSIISSATHFALFKNQDLQFLLRENLKNMRNITILVGHWILHAYGIIALTELKQPTLHAPFLLLVPFPAIFYLLTVKFTNPSSLEKV